MRQLITFIAITTLLATAAYCQISDESKNLFRQAMELNKSRDYGMALNYFMKAYKLSPDILAQDDRGLLDNATSFLQAKVGQNPDSAETHFQLAELLILRGINAEGIKHYEKVVSLAPSGPLAVLAKGEIDRLKMQGSAVAPIDNSSSSGSSSSSGGSSGSGSSGSGSSSGSSNRSSRRQGPRARRRAEVRGLKDRVSNLQDKVAEMQRELDKQKGEVQAERLKTKKVQKELDELKEKSQRWKLYYNLYMRDLGRRGAPSR